MAPSAPQTPNSPFPSPNTVQPSSLSRLTLSDKLLLSQAVHHIGTSPPDWGRVSSILLPHPLIKTKSRLEQAAKAGITLGRVFGSRECERAWVALMRQYNLVLQPGERDVALESENEAGSPAVGNRAKEARGLPPKTDRGSQLALAQFLYAERVREIQEQIKAKEKAFKTLAGEIEALNAGTLDEKLLDELEKSGLLREESDKESMEKEVTISHDDESEDLTPSASQSSAGRREHSATPKKSNSTKTSPKVSKDQRAGSIGGTSASRSPLAEKDKVEKGKAANSMKHSKDSRVTASKSTLKETKSGDSITSPVTAINPSGENLIQDKGQGEILSINNTGDNEKERRDNEEPAVDKERDNEEMDIDTTTNISDIPTGAEKDSNSESKEILSKEDEISNSKRKRDASPSRGDVEEVDSAAAQKKARGEESSSAVDTTQPADVINEAGSTNPQDSGTDQLPIEADSSVSIQSEISGRKESDDTDRADEVDFESEAKKAHKDASAESMPNEEDSVKLEDEETKEESMDVDEAMDELKEKEDAVKEEEEEEENEDAGQSDEHKRPEPRRSRRSARNISVTTDEVPTPPPSATPTTATSAKNIRVEALRSREASGTSADTDEDRIGEDAGDGDASRSTIDRSRTSLSPVATRRGRGASRQSRRSGGRAPSAGISGTQADDVVGSDAEREKAAQVIEKRKMEKVLMMLLNEVSNHTHGNLFHNPIKESDAPDYYTLIRHPLDLKTIKARIKEGRITSATQLRRSLMQMFANSLIYNRPGSEIHRMALEMRDAAEDMLDRFEQTQMSAKVSRR